MAPVYCASSLSPKTTTICNGASVVLILADGPATGVAVEWTSDVGSLAYTEDKAVFTAPSSGAGTARIRVRWGSCDLTSYVAYEHCEGGTAGSDGGNGADTGADGAPDASDESDGQDGPAGDGAETDADGALDASDDASGDAPDAD